MECLEIPVDQRHIRIIGNIKYPPHNIRSPHLDILNIFAKSVEVDGKSIPPKKPITHQNSPAPIQEVVF
jgi:hypothetical protein